MRNVWLYGDFYSESDHSGGYAFRWIYDEDMSAEEYFALGGISDGTLHEECGYLGVCTCVLREGMVESRMDFTDAVHACAAAIHEGWRGNPRDACAGDGACAVLRAARNSGVRAEGTEAGI